MASNKKVRRCESVELNKTLFHRVLLGTLQCTQLPVAHSFYEFAEAMACEIVRAESVTAIRRVWICK